MLLKIIKDPKEFYFNVGFIYQYLLYYKLKLRNWGTQSTQAHFPLVD